MPAGQARILPQTAKFLGSSSLVSFPTSAIRSHRRFSLPLPLFGLWEEGRRYPATILNAVAFTGESVWRPLTPGLPGVLYSVQSRTLYLFGSRVSLRVAFHRGKPQQ